LYHSGRGCITQEDVCAAASIASRVNKPGTRIIACYAAQGKDAAVGELNRAAVAGVCVAADDRNGVVLEVNKVASYGSTNLA